MGTKRFSEELKIQAIKRVLEGTVSQHQIADELGIPQTTLSGWVRRYRQDPSRGIEESMKPTEAELELRRLKRQNRELQEENEILKKSGGLLREEPKIKRFLFIQANEDNFRIARMCKVLMVSKSVYYAWNKTEQTARDFENETLERDIRQIHKKCNGVYGWKKIRKVILSKDISDRNFKGSELNHKRIQRIMKKIGIRSKVCRKY